MTCHVNNIEPWKMSKCTWWCRPHHGVAHIMVSPAFWCCPLYSHTSEMLSGLRSIIIIWLTQHYRGHQCWVTSSRAYSMRLPCCRIRRLRSWVRILWSEHWAIGEVNQLWFGWNIWPVMSAKVDLLDVFVGSSYELRTLQDKWWLFSKYGNVRTNGVFFAYW